MTLEELKTLMGIDLEDTSQDAILSLYLDSAFEAAKAYADKHNFTGELPGAIKLGIVKWIEISRLNESRQGVVSESIGGMSQTFATNANDEDSFAAVYRLWNPYHSNKLVARTVKSKKWPAVTPIGARRL